MIARGGQAVYGQDIGILMLDTRFPRIPGDVGNALTFDFPVRYRVITAATVDKIVADAESARQQLPAFIEAARELERDGVRALVTTCGFLTVFQEELAAAVSIPVVSSSLFLVPLVRRMLGPAHSIGIVTAHGGSLSGAHLTAAGIDPAWPVHVRGLEDSSAFASAILDAGPREDYTLDVEQVREEVVAACRALVEARPDIGAIVFECTNLPPYREAVTRALRLPVFGIDHVVRLLHQAL